MFWGGFVWLVRSLGPPSSALFLWRFLSAERALEASFKPCKGFMHTV